MKSTDTAVLLRAGLSRSSDLPNLTRGMPENLERGLKKVVALVGAL